jgi:D-alanyl-D-alanine dipeptidase
MKVPGSVLLLLAAVGGGCADKPAPKGAAGALAALRNGRQLVVVVSDDWAATTGTLLCYERPDADKPWAQVGGKRPVTLGRNGLAWGRGLHGHPTVAGPAKREGDGKSPAGLFELRYAFGYARKGEARGVKLGYVPLTADVFGVDDPNSKFYDQVVKLGDVLKDWTSAETMRRADDLYEWGVFVGHNTLPAAPGGGSCIFLHLWAGPGKATAGCTAMGREDIVWLVGWLDAKARPLLVQLTREAHRSVAEAWDLPR